MKPSLRGWFFFLYLADNFASLAQLVEQLIRNEQVGGSSPPKGSDGYTENTFQTFFYSTIS